MDSHRYRLLQNIFSCPAVYLGDVSFKRIHLRDLLLGDSMRLSQRLYVFGVNK